jgi:ACS family hexuronate transporter-like MFS transporter
VACPLKRSRYAHLQQFPEALLSTETPSISSSSVQAEAVSPPWYKSYRWWICGLLFFATTINYLDRQSLAMLKPLLQKDLGWTEADYGWMGFGFTLAYAIMFVLAGRFVDRIGVRWGFAIGVIVWSIAAAAHALVPPLARASGHLFAAGSVFATTAVWFAIMRFFLGAGEAVNFPACIKTVARWFPQKERAFATGIFNAGSNVGIMIAPAVVFIAHWWHWQAAFVIIGALGVIWVILWLITYREPEVHPSVSAAELAYIQEGRGEENASKVKLHWTAILRHKQAWAFLLGKFLTDPVWWFYLFWLPSYLKDARGLTLTDSALWLLVPYIAADIGSIGGGWISSKLIKRGYNVGTARYVAMGICALCMPASIAAAFTNNFALALTFISLATAGHQGWSANIFTTASDMFPASLTGSIVGLGGTAGGLGGMFMTLLVGLFLQWTGKYYPIFIWAGFMHILSLALYLILVGPRMTRADVDSPQDRAFHVPLAISGVIVTLIGLAGALVTWTHWQYILDVTNKPGAKEKVASAAAGGLTAAIGFALVGLLLLYAALPKSPPRPIGNT